MFNFCVLLLIVIETETEKLNVSLTKWVNTERFGTFVKITRGNIHQVLVNYRQKSKKYFYRMKTIKVII